MRFNKHLLIIRFHSLHFYSSEKKREEMLNELELTRLPTSVFSENVPTYSIPQPLIINYRGDTVEFQDKGLGIFSNKVDQILFFSPCEEY